MSLSVTTQQMLGKLQDGEIKRFLTGLGNLAKSCEIQGIENSGITRHNSCLRGKERGGSNCNSTPNSVSVKDSYSSRTIDYGNVDTEIISHQTENVIGKSCAVWFIIANLELSRAFHLEAFYLCRWLKLKRYFEFHLNDILILFSSKILFAVLLLLHKA